jgi:hypothetical protein
MALDARALHQAVGDDGTGRRWSGGNSDASPAAAVAADASAVPMVLWSDDERRMKQELVAWAKAVASMVRSSRCRITSRSHYS